MSQKLNKLENKVLGEILKQLRKKQRLSITDFSQRTGICRSYITMVEQGDANPSIEVLDTLFSSLGRRLVFTLRRQRAMNKVESGALSSELMG
jgi:XRE family transcriptional regulator of biofilm formation